MNKILSIEKAIETSQKLRSKNKSIVLVGGVFDILHIGHIRLLEKSKRWADFLFLLLESDQMVKKFKGKNRPINPQSERAEILAALNAVDYIVKLPKIMKSKDYDDIIVKLKPNVLATTKEDPNVYHKLRQAKLLKIKLIYVTERIKNRSSTIIANLI